MTDFRAAIRRSVADQALQAALDGNAERRRKGRLAAFESLPDWRERRRRAHTVRAEVIGRLDEYLEKFSAKARENGIVVHRAKDAAEATGIILEIVVGATHASPILVAKSKSMVSEEIGLNHALEAEGIRVVETDLGEYIVQLRGERPSHIITPAVHLRRHEIAALFQKELGIPYTEDIPALTAAARHALRQVFLTAGVGISGVNFGVAETGTLCIVTNEGNGRMVTTLPPVHIALMGIERIVPSLDDLALMLSLLPRSATGQKLSVYTQLIHGPRRAGESDGARQRHLVLVDNGRSRTQQSPLQEALYCIRCGACLNACPVFREIGGHAYVGDDGSIAPYPGPIGSVVSPGLLGLGQFGHLAQASSLCGACKDACPVDIDLPRLLTRVRAGTHHPLPSPARRGADGIGLSLMSKIGLRAYGTIAASPRLFGLSQTLAGIGTRLVSPFSAWMRLPAFTGWGYGRNFPRFAMKPFRKRFHRADLKNTKVYKQEEKELGDLPVFALRRSSHREDAKSTKILNREEMEPGDLPGFAVQTDGAARFSEELIALGGYIHHTSQEDLTGRLIEFLRERNIAGVQIWDRVAGLEEARLAEAGLRLERRVDPSLKVGITGAQAAIAETGTLVICSGPGRTLAASLLPEIHIAILGVSQLVPSLEQALALKEVLDAASAVLVSGPSRTADIEMTLTIGVHGPKELHVFLIDDGPAR